jgi:hypothetical protein
MAYFEASPSRTGIVGQTLGGVSVKARHPQLHPETIPSHVADRSAFCPFQPLRLTGPLERFPSWLLG